MKGEEYVSLCFRDDTITDPKIKVGVAIAIEFAGGRLSMFRVNWGPEDEWECPFDGAVEQHWFFSEEETKKLMLLTGTSNGEDLIHSIYNRFRDNAHDADYHITQWCKTEGVDYLFYYHRELTKCTKMRLDKMRARKI